MGWRWYPSTFLLVLSLLSFQGSISVRTSSSQRTSLSALSASTSTLSSSSSSAENLRFQELESDDIQLGNDDGSSSVPSAASSMPDSADLKSSPLTPRSITVDLLKDASQVMGGTNSQNEFISYLRSTSKRSKWFVDSEPESRPARKKKKTSKPLRRKKKVKVLRIPDSSRTHPPYPSPYQKTTVQFHKYLDAHSHLADTSRHGVGKSNAQHTFPIPYNLFAKFDEDKSGELNYKEFVKLITFVNDDYVLPKDRRRTTYRVLVETLHGTLLNQSVFITFLGPTGQSSSEVLLKNGFTTGSDMIIIDAEDVAFVARIRLRLSKEVTEQEAWKFHRIVVETHGRVMESPKGPYTIRHALHVTLSPADLHMNDTIAQQALGGPQDEWTKSHYQKYQFHITAWKSWLDKHMEEQAKHNAELSKELTKKIRPPKTANLTQFTFELTDTPANKTKTGKNGTIEPDDEDKAREIALEKARIRGLEEEKRRRLKNMNDFLEGVLTNDSKDSNRTVGEDETPEGLAVVSGRHYPDSQLGLNLTKIAQGINNSLALAQAANSSNSTARNLQNSTLPQQNMTNVSTTNITDSVGNKSQPLSARAASSLRKLASALSKAGDSESSIAAKPAVVVTVEGSGSTGATPIKKSAEKPKPKKKKKKTKTQIAEDLRKDSAYQEWMKGLQQEKEQIMQAQLNDLMKQQMKDMAAAQKAKEQRALAEAIAERKRMKIEGQGPLTFEQKLAQISLELNQTKYGTADGKPKPKKVERQNTSLTDAVNDIDVVDPNGIPSTHKGDGSPVHMWEEHLPGASWGGELPDDQPLFADEANNHKLNFGPLGRFNYLRHGKDWEGECRVGRTQSPILLRSRAARPSNGLFQAQDNKLVLHYKPVLPKHKLQLLHTGHAIIVKGHDELLGWIGSGRNGTKYVVKRIIFHAPAEHRVDYTERSDGRFDMEMQIIHQRAKSMRKTDLLGLAVFFSLQPKNNSFLDSLDWQFMPKKPGMHRLIGGTVDLSKAVRDWSAPYFSYVGSQTTPPCTEPMKWHVVRDPQPISAGQLEKINALFQSNPNFANGEGNNRETQSFNHRPGGLTISAT